MKSFIAILMIVCSILTGCNTKETVETINEDIVIYNPFEEKFINYIKDELSTNYTFAIPKTNHFEYSFDTQSKYYTSGSSSVNNYEIIEYMNGKLKSVYKLEEKEGDAIFPLVSYKNRHFFLKTKYPKDDTPKSTIVEFKDNKLNEYINTKGALTKAVIYNDLIYYTDYDFSNEKYRLYSLDYNNYGSLPTLIKDDLKSDDLFVLNNEIYLSDNDKIYFEDDYFEKKSENYYDIPSNTLIQFEPGESLLVLSIIDAETKKQLKKISKVYGIDFKENMLVVYGDDFMEEVDLLQLKNQNTSK